MQQNILNCFLYKFLFMIDIINVFFYFQWIMPNYATMPATHDIRQPGASLPKTKDSSGGKTKDTYVEEP